MYIYTYMCVCVMCVYKYKYTGYHVGFDWSLIFYQVLGHPSCLMVNGMIKRTREFSWSINSLGASSRWIIILLAYKKTRAWKNTTQPLLDKAAMVNCRSRSWINCITNILSSLVHCEVVGTCNLPKSSHNVSLKQRDIQAFELAFNSFI